MRGLATEALRGRRKRDTRGFGAYFLAEEFDHDYPPKVSPSAPEREAGRSAVRLRAFSLAKARGPEKERGRTGI